MQCPPPQLCEVLRGQTGLAWCSSIKLDHSKILLVLVVKSYEQLLWIWYWQMDTTQKIVVWLSDHCQGSPEVYRTHSMLVTNLIVKYKHSYKSQVMAGKNNKGCDKTECCWAWLDDNWLKSEHISTAKISVMSYSILHCPEFFFLFSLWKKTHFGKNKRNKTIKAANEMFTYWLNNLQQKKKIISIIFILLFLHFNCLE